MRHISKIGNAHPAHLCSRIIDFMRGSSSSNHKVHGRKSSESSVFEPANDWKGHQKIQPNNNRTDMNELQKSDMIGGLQWTRRTSYFSALW